MLKYVLLILGFVFLIKGADLFVDGSSSIAKLLKVPTLIIGLTIVAMGTSLPEASVSVTAAMAGQNALSLSNVLGSNLFNLLVVVGACALIRPMPVEQSVLKREFPFSIVITVVLFLLSIDQFIFHSDSLLSRADGIILLIFFVGFIVFTVKSALKSRSNASEEEIEVTLSPLKSVIFIIIGIVGIALGGDLVVDSASAIATTFGLSETLIGLTIVALGTSLPELVTSIVAARKNESDLALGNVVGSNLFNILFVLGMSASIHPIGVGMDSVIDTLILIITSILVYIFAILKKSINRIEGFSMLLMYAAFMVYIIIR